MADEPQVFAWQVRDALRGVKLPRGVKPVVMALALFANAKGEMFPTSKALAAVTGKGERQVQYVLAWLAAEGIVPIVSAPPGQHVTRRIDLDALATWSKEPPSGSAPPSETAWDCTPPPSGSAPTPVQLCTQRDKKGH
jgi:hypothetical protein